MISIFIIDFFNKWLIISLPWRPPLPIYCYSPIKRFPLVTIYVTIELLYFCLFKVHNCVSQSIVLILIDSSRRDKTSTSNNIYVLINTLCFTQNKGLDQKLFKSLFLKLVNIFSKLARDQYKQLKIYILLSYIICNLI